MLASVYNYRVMAKSITCCCVRGRRVISNPVTYSNVATCGGLADNHADYDYVAS